MLSSSQQPAASTSTGEGISVCLTASHQRADSVEWGDNTALLMFCYLETVRPCATMALSLRCCSCLSRVSRISLSTAVSGSSRGLRYTESPRPESSEPGDRVEVKGGWTVLGEDGEKPI